MIHNFLYLQGGAGRSEPSFGRKRRDVNETKLEDTDPKSNVTFITTVVSSDMNNTVEEDVDGVEEQVREMIEVIFMQYITIIYNL